MEDELLYQQIDDFLAGRMTPEEKATFQKRLEEDAALEELVSFRFMENEIEGLLFAEEIDSIAQSWREEEEKTQQGIEPNNKRRNSKGWLWLLLLGVLIAGGLYVINHLSGPSEPAPNELEGNLETDPLGSPAIQDDLENTKSTTPALDNSRDPSPSNAAPNSPPIASTAEQNRLLALRYASNSISISKELEDSRDITRSDRSEAESEKQIDSLIRLKDFQTVAIRLEDRLQRNPDDFIQLNYELGMVYFLGKEYGKAADHLERIANNLDNENINQTQYLLLLSYLANNRGEQARSIGERIAQKGNISPYFSSVQELLKQIEK